jgi:hypothetical protein
VRENDQVAGGFFFALDFGAFGCATTASGFRSIEVRRPAVKV